MLKDEAITNLEGIHGVLHTRLIGFDDLPSDKLYILIKSVTE